METPRVFAATGRVWAGWGRGIGDKGCLDELRVGLGPLVGPCYGFGLPTRCDVLRGGLCLA